MRDPEEGRAADGTIRTGADARRVPASYRPVLAAAVDAVRDRGPSATLAVYGSVATGRARRPTSDVDLLAVGLSPVEARALGRSLSERFASLCREVAVAVLPGEHLGDDPGAGTGVDPDAAYGDRVFLRHYAVVVHGPDRARDWPAFPADVRAARGFNGDVGDHARRWRALLEAEAPGRLGRVVARKTLLATAGLVSVHDGTWTTDRGTAARRWGELHPDRAPGLERLLGWCDGPPPDSRSEVRDALDGVVRHVVHEFERRIGLWRGPAGAGPVRGR